MLSACHRSAPESRAPITFGGRQWTAIQRTARPAKDRDYIVEYAPNGQDASNWSELLSVQHFRMPPGTAGTARDFAAQVSQSMRESGQAYKGTSLVANTQEFIMDLSHAHEEENLVKVVAIGPDPMHAQAFDAIIYTKKSLLQPQEKAHWVQLLQSTTTEQLVGK